MSKFNVLDASGDIDIIELDVGWGTDACCKKLNYRYTGGARASLSTDGNGYVFSIQVGGKDSEWRHIEFDYSEVHTLECLMRVMRHVTGDTGRTTIVEIGGEIP